MGSARATRVYMCILVVFAILSLPVSSRAYEVLDLKGDIMQHCRFYINKNLGTADPAYDSVCCNVVRQANVVDICQQFTDEDKAKIELWKWVRVTRMCENALPLGTNCAGYVVHSTAQ